ATHYTSHFNLPDNGAKGSIAGTSYSFDYGPVHVTVLNTESNLKKQTEWLKEDLKNTDKKWKIVAMHRPAYGGNSYKKVENWTDIFDMYEVDLVLQGHNHEYSRSYPLRGGKIVPEGEISKDAKRGTVYVVTNASGGKFNEKKEDQFYHAVHFQNYKQMFAGINVTGDTLTYQAYDVDGKLLDEFVLTH
ncbi:metallophosphoesterase, partial [Paenibacillus odorifer]